MAAVATRTASLPGCPYVLGLLRQRSGPAVLWSAAIRVSSRPQTKHEELGANVPAGLGHSATPGPDRACATARAEARPRTTEVVRQDRAVVKATDEPARHDCAYYGR